MSFPSKTNRRWVRPSMGEILNILFPNACDKGNGRAKPESVQSDEFSIRGWNQLVVESQRCSKHN
jgi:hypothetical protein